MITENVLQLTKFSERNQTPKNTENILQKKILRQNKQSNFLKKKKKNL